MLEENSKYDLTYKDTLFKMDTLASSLFDVNEGKQNFLTDKNRVLNHLKKKGGDLMQLKQKQKLLTETKKRLIEEKGQL